MDPAAGFEVFADVFTATECDRLVSKLDPINRGQAGLRHLLQEFRELAEDNRLISLASVALKGCPIPFRITLFDKTPATNWRVVWHQDTVLPVRHRVEARGWGPWSEKDGVLCARAPADALERVVALRVHLDDSTTGNGPLRVIPGSHDRGVLPEEDIARLVEASEPVECVVARGGVIAMRPLMVHSSARIADTRPRRVLHLEYCDSLALGAGVEIARA